MTDHLLLYWIQGIWLFSIKKFRKVGSLLPKLKTEFEVIMIENGLYLWIDSLMKRAWLKRKQTIR